MRARLSVLVARVIGRSGSHCRPWAPHLPVHVAAPLSLEGVACAGASMLYGSLAVVERGDRDLGGRVDWGHAVVVIWPRTAQRSGHHRNLTA